MQELIAAMRETYEFVIKTLDLHHIEAHAEVVKRMSDLTIECSDYICNYVSNGPFCELVAYKSHLDGY